MQYTRVDKTTDTSPQSATDALSTAQEVARTMSINELRPPLSIQPPIVPVSSVLVMANNVQLSSTHTVS